MGLVAAIIEPLQGQLSYRSVGAIIGGGLISFIVLAIVVNVLGQLIFKNPNEPPLVFHWVPYFGSTIAYGIDPYDFFFRCQRKVRTPPN